MRFYVGSSFSNIEEVRFIRDHLLAFGHTHTYDWTQNARAASIDALRAIGEEEVAGIQTADFVVILLPGGKGAHVELGIALGTNKPVFLYDLGDQMMNMEETSTFYHVDAVQRLEGPFYDLPHRIQGRLELFNHV
ncbi:nucleoside 2-deoxyribosyltransferase [Exiguobacterium sp. MER 193]|uniref:nucleoside 2-deoxyribosyltransferase n=1 Tax=Exiguobacterium sp. MER 193 TaxID=2939564 RepID=UPI00203C5180|nr:nucleoside 2-deoxyribosyltransferase [Exiguobacterium sp. MER 193]MCM3280223.1 nucleoside 2-deoxyribosyltransferase [Exiguobacterium sp. MER 193]